MLLPGGRAALRGGAVAGTFQSTVVFVTPETICHARPPPGLTAICVKLSGKWAPKTANV